LWTLLRKGGGKEYLSRERMGIKNSRKKGWGAPRERSEVRGWGEKVGFRFDQEFCWGGRREGEATEKRGIAWGGKEGGREPVVPCSYSERRKAPS